MSSTPSTGIVAEYAKSNRSSCKKCAKSIPKGRLRLGSVTKEARGYDMIRWFHLDCFSQPVISVESITGLEGLKSSDREVLKEWVSKCGETLEEIVDEGDPVHEKKQGRSFTKLRVHARDEEEDNEESKNLTKPKVADGGDHAHEKKEGKSFTKFGVHGRDEEENNEESRNSKKPKLDTPAQEAKLEISLSASDIMDKYKGATLLPKYKAFQTVIFLERDEGLRDSRKIAAFDFDGCLAKTSVNRVGADAWSLMYPSIPGKLQSLYNDGHKLVIFTNEANIDRWKNKRQLAVNSKVGRLNNFIKIASVPIQVFIACGVGKVGSHEDPFRKPKPGMWRLMEKYFNSGISIDIDQSFYVGDAAGRPDDHSNADIKFAEAIGLKFYTPEEYFGA